VTSQPGLGPLLGARVLAEFGDDRSRYADAKARQNYAAGNVAHSSVGEADRGPAGGHAIQGG
jgi:hypothetical protein